MAFLNDDDELDTSGGEEVEAEDQVCEHLWFRRYCQLMQHWCIQRVVSSSSRSSSHSIPSTSRTVSSSSTNSSTSLVTSSSNATRINQSLQPPSQPLAAHSNNSTQAPVRTVARVPSLTFLPAAIWSQPWAAPRSFNSELGSLEDLPNSVFDIATDNTPIRPFEIRGVDVNALVKVLYDKIAEALATQDFTDVLSPNREFLV